MITVIQLECFLEAVKQKSFSQAASNLYLSQPTLSRHIQALEEELRVLLFIRANNTIRLSAMGQALYPKLENLYNSYLDATREMHEMVDLRSGILRIGFQASLQVETEFRDAIKVIKEVYPDARIQICHLSVAEMNTALMSGAIDLLVSLSPSVPVTDKIHSLILRNERMRLAVPANHPNAGLESIDEDEVSKYFGDLEFCLLDAHEFESSLQDELMNQVDYQNPELIKLSGPFAELDAMMMMVDAGLGITVVNENCILKNDPNIVLIPIEDSGDTRHEASLGAYWIDKNENHLVFSFLEALKKNYSKTSRGDES